MGTRADFYVGRGVEAEWLGSIGWDGYPSGTPNSILKAKTEKDYRKKVKVLLDEDDSATLPEQGWPWPWKDSGSTDYAYAFDDNKVWISEFGHTWFDAASIKLDHDDENEEENSFKDAVFPDMTARMNVTIGTKRSGIIAI